MTKAKQSVYGNLPVDPLPRRKAKQRDAITWEAYLIYLLAITSAADSEGAMAKRVNQEKSNAKRIVSVPRRKGHKTVEDGRVCCISD